MCKSFVSIEMSVISNITLTGFLHRILILQNGKYSTGPPESDVWRFYASLRGRPAGYANRSIICYAKNALRV